MRLRDNLTLRIKKVRKSDFRLQMVDIEPNAKATLIKGNRLAIYDVRAAIYYQDELVDEIKATFSNGSYGDEIPDDLWGETDQEIILRRVSESLDKRLMQQYLSPFEIFKESIRQCYLKKVFLSVYGLDYHKHISPDEMIDSFENLYCMIYPEAFYHCIIFGKDKDEILKKIPNLSFYKQYFAEDTKRGECDGQPYINHLAIVVPD